MNQKTQHYNLLVEDWIPILWTNGKPGRVGIREALTKAGRIRQIAASNPMDNVALLRLLLAVLQWCKPSLTDEEREWLQTADGIRKDWLRKKLGTEGHPNAAFDLLGVKAGFYQDDSIQGVTLAAVTNLLHELPSGSKIAHFRHCRDYRDGLCLSCCATGLARWPGAASAGTAGKGQNMTASINGNTPTYSVPVGASLLATLLLSWRGVQRVSGDAPLWDGSTEQSPLGFLKGMTWLSRRVLLPPPDHRGQRDLSVGRCCNCGEETDRLVRWILFRPGWKRPSKEPWSQDPHLLRITRKEARSAKERDIVPSWPSPDDPSEDHAGVWRSVLEGLLQKSAVSETGPTEFRTTLLGASQALYKHVGTHAVALPGLSSNMAHRLLKEVEWLRKITWMTTAARSRNWSDSPRGHFVVGALCSPGAKGHVIRAGLSARSPLTECELEKAFLELTHHLAASVQPGGNTIEQVIADWRRRASEIIVNHVVKVVDAATSGSPLRRREASQRVDGAIREAVRQVAQQEMKAAAKPKRGQ